MTTTVGRRRRIGTVVAVLAVVVLLSLVIFRHVIAAFAVDAGLSALTASNARVDSFSFGTHFVELRGVRVQRHGATVLSARRIAVRYSVRDLLPGGRRRFGLEDVELDEPALILRRRADGTFDIPGGAPSAQRAKAQAPTTPLRLHVRVHDGRIVLRDPYRQDPVSRNFVVDGVTIGGVIDTAARTAYRMHADYQAEGRHFPIDAAGVDDAPRGIALYRIRSPAIPLRELANYFISGHVASLRRGAARDVSILLYRLGSAPYHLSGTLRLAAVQMGVGALQYPLNDLGGRVDVTDDGLEAPHLSASVGGIGLAIAGGLFDFSDPRVHVGVVSAAPLERLRAIFRFSQDQPLSGDVALRLLFEGPVGEPLILTRLLSENAAYRAVPIAHLDGTVAYYRNAALMVPFAARYGALNVDARGAFLIGDHVDAEAYVGVNGPAASVPYAAQTIPDATLHVSGLLGGRDGAFATRGIVTANGGGDALAGFFHVDARGDGEFGPVLASRADGSSAAGGLILNRSNSRSAFWLDARRFTMVAPTSPPSLPGLPQVAPPQFSGVFDAALGGEGPPSAFAVAGRIEGNGLRIGGVRIDAVRGGLLGSPADTRLAGVQAEGPWGTFSGTAAFGGGLVGMSGQYRGTFARLEPFTGHLGAIGSVAAPVSLVFGPGGTLVQTTAAQTQGGALRGVPLDRLAGTVFVGKSGVRVYDAQATVAAAPLAAAGRLAPGGVLGLAVAGASARQLRGLGLPLDDGTIDALGAATLDTGQLSFSGGAVVDRAHYHRIPVDANGDLRLAGARLDFARVDGRLATVYGSGGGLLSGIGTRAVRYDAKIRVRAADLGDAATTFASAPYALDGSADADLRIGGSGAEPRITGRVVLPEATINGLFIDRFSGVVSAAPSLLAIDDGRVTVGSTVTAFSGTFQRHRRLTLAARAPHADLADFQDFFDEGDFLAGKGKVAMTFERRHGLAATSGAVAMSGLRLAHFDFGDATAAWQSTGSRVSGRTGFSGRLGRLQATGKIDLPTTGSVRSLLVRSNYNVQGRAAGVDLGAWLPALGYSAPVGGTLSIDGTLRGRYPALALTGDAALVGGTYGKLPIDRLTIAAVSSVARTTITDAQLEVGTVTVRGSGYFGYGAKQPLDMRLHASSPDIGTVVAKLSGDALPLHGSFQADVHAGGRAAHPLIDGGFDIENASLHGVAIPRALGEFAVSGRDVELRDAEVTFRSGTLALAGSVPLRLAPLTLGPPQAPVTLEVAPKAINLADFAPLMPADSRIGGTLDGRVAIRGTVTNPRLVGEIALARGELLLSTVERNPLTNVSGALSFEGTSAHLNRLHADIGGGHVNVVGSVNVQNLGRLADASTYDLTAALSRARIDMPAYGRGVVDGTVALRHDPGQLPRAQGEVSLQDAVIPFSALYNPSAGGSQTEFPLQTAGGTLFGLPNTALALSFTAGKDVRVRSSVLDIGGAGTVSLGGTLAAPQLTGGFEATDGTLTYFNRVFRIAEGSVSFLPGEGIVPVLDARATTHVINPDPNIERNLTGSADITLSVRGPVTNLSIALDSDPPYDRQQILGLLLNAPAVGATTLFANTPPPGTLAPLAFQGTTATGGITVGQTAFSLLNAQFTRNLLSPFESSLGGALGLSDVNVTLDYTGAVGVSARKLLGKNIYAVYGTTFGYPYRQTFGFELRPTPETAAQFTFYETIGDVYGYITSPVTGAVSRETLSQPITGTSGFSFSLQRFFW